jgi:uncharacterized phage-associated protein
MLITSLQAAKKVCELSNWCVTNLSLQKIIYFCHMFHLGKHQKPLINEVFEAWIYGPVLPKLYDKLKIYGADYISDNFYNVSDIGDKEINSFLEEVAGALLQRKPWELVTLTHSKTGAWAKNYVSGVNRKISNEDILEEYREFNERNK